MSKIVDITGKRFGMLTVISFSHIREKYRLAFWLCKCDCGNFKVTAGSCLKNGNTRSCGCMFRAAALERVKTRRNYGQSRTPEYGSWAQMIKRCYDPNNISYKNYGARNIKVCAGLHDSFQYFLTIIGNRPSSKHSVDRIDNSLNYSCGKCKECISRGWKMNIRWSTKGVQLRNKRNNVWIEYKGERMVQTDWAKRFKVKDHTFIGYRERHSLQETMDYYSSRLETNETT